MIKFQKNTLYYILLSLVLLLFLVTIIRIAWVGDDAFITFRSIDNVVNGHGLTWNVGERVQVFTHPLWMFVMTFFYFFTREAFFTSIIVSIILSLATVIFISRVIVKNRAFALIAVVLLTISKSFTDYTTSGLENALSYLLTAIFLYILFKETYTRKHLFTLSLLGSLIILNRMDLLLIIFPPLCYALWNYYKKHKTIKSIVNAVLIMAAGFLPLIMWELFSLFYYGSVFPNTYYAKLNNSFTIPWLLKRAVKYYINSLVWDPFTLLTIAFACIAVIFVPRKKALYIAILAGVLLYLGYILKIGSGFMSGRFFSVPFLVCIISCAYFLPFSIKPYYTASVVAVLIIAALIIPRSPVKFILSKDHKLCFSNTYIADERIFYSQKYNLFSVLKSGKVEHPWADLGREYNQKARDAKKKIYEERITIGLSGYFAGPDVYIFDSFALSAPLLSHLTGEGRIGHIRRAFPYGYYHVVTTGEYIFKNKLLEDYYRTLSTIIHGKLFSLKRLYSIVKINLGYDKKELNRVYHIESPVPLSAFPNKQEEDMHWQYNRNIGVRGPLVIDLEKTYHTSTVEMALYEKYTYTINFSNDTGIIATLTNPAAEKPKKLLAVRIFEVPEEAVESGYNKIEIVPESDSVIYSVGHVILP